MIKRILAWGVLLIIMFMTFICIRGEPVKNIDLENRHTEEYITMEEENKNNDNIVENNTETEEENKKEYITIYDTFTPEEIYLFQRCVETETYTASIRSKINVANVILNRLQDGRFGNSIIEVITADNQFAYWRTAISDETVEAIELAWLYDYTDGALFFHSANGHHFNSYVFLFVDDIGHHFYK